MAASRLASLAGGSKWRQCDVFGLWGFHASTTAKAIQRHPQQPREPAWSELRPDHPLCHQPPMGLNRKFFIWKPARMDGHDFIIRRLGSSPEEPAIAVQADGEKVDAM